MEAAQHKFTFVLLNFRHDKQFADRSEDMRRNNRIIG
jgi:hypothetical protein